MNKNMILFSLNQAIDNKLLDNNEIINKIRNYVYNGDLTESEVKDMVDKLFPPVLDEEGNIIEETELLPLDFVKEKKIEELKQACTNAIYEGFTAINGHTYGFNQHDQMNFTQQMMLISQGSTSDILWKTKDAGVVTHTVEEFMQVVEDVKNHKSTQQQKYWDLEQQVLTATTKEEVLNIKWE